MLDLDLWNCIFQFLDLYNIFNFYLTSKIQISQINFLKFFDKNKIENDNIFINTSKNMRYFIIYILRTIKNGNFLYIYSDIKYKIEYEKYKDVVYGGIPWCHNKYFYQFITKFKNVTIINGQSLIFNIDVTLNNKLEGLNLDLIASNNDYFLKFVESCKLLKQISIRLWIEPKKLIKLINIRHVKRWRIILNILEKEHINEILKLDLKDIHIATRKLFLYEQYKNYRKNLTMELIIVGREYIILNKK